MRFIHKSGYRSRAGYSGARTVNSLIVNLTLFLPGEGGISPLIVYHVTKSVRNRVKKRNSRITSDK